MIPHPTSCTDMTIHEHMIAAAKATLEAEGFVIIEQRRIQVLASTASISDEIAYLKEPPSDYMDYVKKQIAYEMAGELGASDAITWSITKDKYLPCTRIGGKLIVVRPA
jgi:hypothetical protein